MVYFKTASLESVPFKGRRHCYMVQGGLLTPTLLAAVL